MLSKKIYFKVKIRGFNIVCRCRLNLCVCVGACFGGGWILLVFEIENVYIDRKNKIKYKLVKYQRMAHIYPNNNKQHIFSGNYLRHGIAQNLNKNLIYFRYLFICLHYSLTFSHSVLQSKKKKQLNLL